MLLLFVSVAFASCNCNSPKATAEKFTESMAKGNVEEAKKYMTPGTASLLDMMVKMTGSATDVIPTYPDFKFEMIKDSIVGDTAAWITYKGPQGNNEELTLVKQDGDWKVTMGK